MVLRDTVILLFSEVANIIGASTYFALFPCYVKTNADISNGVFFILFLPVNTYIFA